MDPLSIATASGSLAVLCVRVATTIFDVTSSIQNVDDDLLGLHHELLGLSGVLEGIENTWKKNHDNLATYSGTDANLWSSISENVSSGMETVAKLEKAFTKANKTSSFSHGFLRKPVKALKLSLSSDDITKYRQRIHSHQLAMQSGLQMISLCLQIQETTSTQKLDMSLTTLGTMINAITERLDTLKADLTRPDTSIASPGTVENDGVIAGLQSMAQAAKSLYSSASTVIEGERSTINGGSIRGDPLTEDHFRNIHDWIPPAANDLPENNASGDAAPTIPPAANDLPENNASDDPARTIRTDKQSATNATAPEFSNPDFLGRGINTVKKAIEHDNNGDYERAYRSYYSALDFFVLSLKWEKNPRTKEMIRLKTTEYMDRAEKLKAYLNPEGSTSIKPSSAKSSAAASSATTSSTTTLVATRLPSNPGTPHIFPPNISRKLFVSYVAKMEDIAGAENVHIVTSNDTLCRYISEALDILCIPPRANLFLSTVISPRNVEDVRELLHDLLYFGHIPVWPFCSTGEYDYRLAIPRVPGSLGLNLAKHMNNILEVNEERLYAVVEPGVSYAALACEITKRGLDDRFWIDWPRSSNKLIVDQALEQGSKARACGLEVILPEGDILQTGVLGSHEERGLPKDRTLEQSLGTNLVPVQCLGVVTKAAINLRPKTSESQPFLITFGKNDDLPEIIDIARQLRLNGLINHDLRLRHMLLDSAVLPEGSPLKPAFTPTHSTLSSRAQEVQLDYWNLYGVINQREPLRDTCWEAIKASFKSVEGINFHLSKPDSPIRFRNYIQERSSPRFSASIDGSDLVLGESRSAHMMCSWTSRVNTGPTARMMHLTSHKRTQEAGYNLMSEFVLAHDQLIYNTHIKFQTDSNAPKKVQNLIRTLLKDSIAHRWEDFRTHPVLMDQIISRGTEKGMGHFWQKAMVAAAKDAVDSRGILAPGRNGIWPKQAFSAAWEAVMEEF